MVAVSHDDQGAFFGASRRDGQRQCGRPRGIPVGDPFVDRIDSQPRPWQQPVDRFAAGREGFFQPMMLCRCRDAVNSTTQFLQQLFMFCRRRLGGGRLGWLGLCFDRWRLCPKLKC